MNNIRAVSNSAFQVWRLGMQRIFSYVFTPLSPYIFSSEAQAFCEGLGDVSACSLIELSDKDNSSTELPFLTQFISHLGPLLIVKSQFTEKKVPETDDL